MTPDDIPTDEEVDEYEDYIEACAEQQFRERIEEHEKEESYKDYLIELKEKYDRELIESYEEEKRRQFFRETWMNNRGHGITVSNKPKQGIDGRYIMKNPEQKLLVALNTTEFLTASEIENKLGKDVYCAKTIRHKMKELTKSGKVECSKKGNANSWRLKN